MIETNSNSPKIPLQHAGSPITGTDWNSPNHPDSRGILNSKPWSNDTMETAERKKLFLLDQPLR